MRKFYYAFGLIFLFLAFMSINVDGQIRYVDVDPGIGTLNDSISGDTTDLGERIDPENTVFRLERGDQAYYGLTGSISNSGYPLTIMAADGDGARPFLQPRDEGGGSSRAFRPRGDITLKGLHVTNLDQLGGLNDRMLRCDDAGIRVELDDCWFDQSSQSFIRVDDPDMTFVITNCVISNIGQPKDPNNGRGIDDRGNAIDTVIIENTTFFNLTSRVIRDDGGVIDYAHLNNVTMVNIAQMGITFGPVNTLILTNSISMNAGFIPKQDDNGWFVFAADSVGGVAPDVTMTNNTAYLDTTKIEDYLVDTTSVTPLFNPTMVAALVESGDIDLNNNWNIEFTDGPPFNDSIFIYIFDPLFQGGEAPAWVVPDIPPGGNDLYHLDVYYDFGYANSDAKTGGTDGLQLGDRNWEATNTVGVGPYVTESKSDMSIYPMPVSGHTTISFEMQTDGPVLMEVYTITGQRVAEILNKDYQAGSHQVNWNAERLEPGMYMLLMKTGKNLSSLKMIVQ